MPTRPRSVSADALRLLVVALCALPMLSALAGGPAARLSAREAVLPHVSFTTMVKLTVIGAVVNNRHHATGGTGGQGALSASVPGSLPKSAAAATPKAAQPPPPPGYPSCFDTVQVRLRVAGYTQKVLGDTTPGGQLALLKQITAGCNANIRSDQVAVQSLFNAKKTSVQSSDFMFWGWLTPAAPGASILKNVGYGPTPIAQSMKSTYKLTAAQMAQVLKDLGYGATPNMQALKDVYTLDAQSSSQILKNLTPTGYTSTQNMQALVDVFKLGAQPASQIIKNVGYNASQNGQALLDVFKLGAQPDSQILRNVGYTATQNGQALVDVFKLDAQPDSQILKNVGYSATENGQALKDVFTLGAQPDSQILKNVGYSASQNGQALKDVFTLGAQPDSQILKNVGYSASQNGQAMKDVFGSTAPQMSQILFNDGYTAPQNGQALVDVFPGVTAVVAAGYLKTDGYNPKDVGTTLRDIYHVTADQMAQIFRDNSYSAHDNAVNLRDLYGSGPIDVAKALAKVTPAYPILDIATVVKNDFIQSSSQTVHALWSASFARDPIAGAVKSVFSLTVASDLARALTVDYGPCNTALGTLSAFTLDANGLATTLKAIPYGVNDVATGLNCAFPNLGANGVTPVLKFANFGVVDTSNALKFVFPTLPDSGMAVALKPSFGINDVASNVGRIYTLGLDGLGKALGGDPSFRTYSAAEIGDALKTAYQASAENMAHALGSNGAGFAVLDVANVLNGPSFTQGAGDATKWLNGAGYPPKDLGDALDQVFHKNALDSGNILKGQGFQAPTVAEMLKNSSFNIPIDTQGGPIGIAKLLVQMNFDPAGVATALRDTYTAPVALVGAYLKLAGMTVNVIGSVLHDVYNVGEQAISGLLVSINGTIDEVSGVLHDKYGLAGDVAAGYLKIAGFGINAVGAALKVTWGLSKATVETFLHVAGWTLDQVGDFIDDVWDALGDAWDAIGDIF